MTTGADLIAALSRHVKSPGYPPGKVHACLECWLDWPCDVGRVVSTIDPAAVLLTESDLAAALHATSIHDHGTVSCLRCERTAAAILAAARTKGADHAG